MNKKEHKNFKKALDHLTSTLSRLTKKGSEEIDALERDLLEERGFLKYFIWIGDMFNKVGKTVKIMMVAMFISVLGVFGYLVFSDRSNRVEYVFVPNKTVLKTTSYLMKIKDKETLDTLKAHPSIYREDRLAIGTYLEKTSDGHLIGNNEQSIKTKFKELIDYNGSNENILGFNFRAEKYTVSHKRLCHLIENETVLNSLLSSTKVTEKNKMNVSIGACVLESSDGKGYAIHPKEVFENGLFTFLD